MKLIEILIIRLNIITHIKTVNLNSSCNNLSKNIKKKTFIINIKKDNSIFEFYNISTSKVY